MFLAHFHSKWHHNEHSWHVHFILKWFWINNTVTFQNLKGSQKKKKKKRANKPKIKWSVLPVTILQLFRSPTQKHPWISMYSSRGSLYIYKQICLYILPQMVAVYTNIIHISHVTIYFGSFYMITHRTTSFFSMAAYAWFQTVPSLIWPLPCWWTFGLLHSSATTNNAE